MCQSRSVGARSTPRAAATSPVWIQHSASRVVASVRADRSPTTQLQRAAALHASRAAHSAATAARQRASRSTGARPRSAPTAISAASSTVPWARVDPVPRHLRQPALRARGAQLVGLREVQHHVGNRPAGAARGRRPAVRVEPREQAVELRLLGPQGLHDLLHAAPFLWAGPSLGGRRSWHDPAYAPRWPAEGVRQWSSRPSRGTPCAPTARGASACVASSQRSRPRPTSP